MAGNKQSIHKSLAYKGTSQARVDRIWLKSVSQTSGVHCVNVLGLSAPDELAHVCMLGYSLLMHRMVSVGAI